MDLSGMLEKAYNRSFNSLQNVRLSESLYIVKGVGEHRKRVDELNRLVKSPASESSCLPSGFHEAKKIDMIEKPNIQLSKRVPNKSMDSMPSDHTVYVESDISDELRNKPLWVLKIAKDRNLQRLVHMSADLATQIGTFLKNSQNNIVR
ncbi:hypothetical protein V6N13_102074 [Hibiscus sabdariffa]|uniref:Uncharacterized protein n=1 Tax=Hibiscus sabdariffa TaxID=183260 RepID=A0ABR2D2Z4_9ROSI